MLQTTIDPNTRDLIVRGEFFEFDRIYFLVERLAGNHGIDKQPPLPAYKNAAELLLSLNYEIRHAENGDRELYTCWSGIHSHWIAPAGTPVGQIIKPENVLDPDDIINEIEDALLFDLDVEPETLYDMDESDQDELLEKLLLETNISPESIEIFTEWLRRKPLYSFAHEDYPEAAEINTYLQFSLPFTEALLDALVIHELSKRKKELICGFYTVARQDEHGLREYELHYCDTRLRPELLLLETLQERIFSDVRELIGTSAYSRFRDYLENADLFRDLTETRRNELEKAADRWKAADKESVMTFLKSIGVPELS